MIWIENDKEFTQAEQDAHGARAEEFTQTLQTALTQRGIRLNVETDPPTPYDPGGVKISPIPQEKAASIEHYMNMERALRFARVPRYIFQFPGQYTTIATPNDIPALVNKIGSEWDVIKSPAECSDVTNPHIAPHNPKEPERDK